MSHSFMNLAEHGAISVGSHGPVEAMGVPRRPTSELDHIQILVGPAPLENTFAG